MHYHLFFQSKNSKITGFVIAALLLCSTTCFSQNVASFFTDSNNDSYYDTGLAFFTPPSSIEQSGPAGFMDKIPVSTTFKKNGANSLKISWTSNPSGDWSALAIAPGWIFQDISQLDTLSFWLFSEQVIEHDQLPTIFMEGAPGVTKSNKVPLSDFMPDGIPQGEWIRAKIPLTVFFDDPNQTNIDFTQIKAIIFGQGQADAMPHTFYVDDILAYNNDQIQLPTTPDGFTVLGEYERHAELDWNPLTANGLTGYNIYRSVDNGVFFEFLKFIEIEQSKCIAWTGDEGTDKSFQFKISSVNFLGQESALSEAVVANSATMSDEAFMDMVQEYTFRYFWEFAHPVSGMIRERNAPNSSNTVTTGGTGFGIMALLVGIERGFISREEGLQRILKIVNFLENTDQFKGVFPHWVNGNTGNVIPFSQYDDGGDLVETSFLMEGLLTARSYFDQNQTDEIILRDKISQMWEAIDWEWYRQGGQDVLYWHWSPNFDWQMNLPIIGFHEGHIIYILAAASGNPNLIPLYENGWAGNQNYENGDSFYGFPLEVGKDFGGPLFFSHYSYIGFDPRGKKDQYTNYFNRNTYHTLINRAYCIDNPQGHTGYSNTCWGLTSSDDPLVGYTAHQPSNDNGTITPTAALSSMPYTPDFSMDALKHFYRIHGDRLWGLMGFYDAFNLNEDWYADSYLAIDQGPIICMIENHRTGLLWEKFMSNPEIQQAVNLLGFVPDEDIVLGVNEVNNTLIKNVNIYPNPASSDELFIQLRLLESNPIKVECFNENGQLLYLKSFENPFVGENTFNLSLNHLNIVKGKYFFRISSQSNSVTKKVILFD